MLQVALVQPRHIYAPDDSSGPPGRIYMPTSLLTAGARILHAGVSVSIHDEDIARSAPPSDVIGINLLGAPYVTFSREFVSRVSGQGGPFWSEVKWLLVLAQGSSLTCSSQML